MNDNDTDLNRCRFIISLWWAGSDSASGPGAICLTSLLQRFNVSMWSYDSCVCVYSQKCKVVDSEAPPLKQDPPSSTARPSSSAPSLSGFPALALLVSTTLHLMTCEFNWHRQSLKHDTPKPQNSCSTRTHRKHISSSETQRCQIIKISI